MVSKILYLVIISGIHSLLQVVRRLDSTLCLNGFWCLVTLRAAPIKCPLGEQRSELDKPSQLKNGQLGPYFVNPVLMW